MGLIEKERNVSSGDIEILRTRLFHNGQAIEQAFDFLAVIDFEATCVQKPPDVYIQEIIEFPIVLIDIAQQKIVGIYDRIFPFLICLAFSLGRDISCVLSTSTITDSI